MGQTTHIIGVPGAGKTQTLADSTRRSVLDAGRSVAIVSLTNAAAEEIKDRTGLTDANAAWVGTLHKACMETLGVRSSELTVSHVDDWNERCEEDDRLHRGWAMTAKKRSVDAPPEGPSDSGGDALYESIDLMRQRLVPESEWAKRIAMAGGNGEMAASFWEAWTHWKRLRGLYDFTDLIEQACEAPQNPLHGDFSTDSLVVDECQDFSALELKLVRDVWGPEVDHLVLAGDADQQLYAWRGSDPRIFLDHGEGELRVLDHSHRCPRAVQRAADQIIRQVDERVPVVWTARDEEGEVTREWLLTTRHGLEWMRKIEPWLAEGSVMMLGATKYQLGGLIGAARDLGIPFANPWRPTSGDWNPLKRGPNATWRKLLRFCDPEGGDWSPEDLLAWMPMLRVGGTLRRGVKSKLPFAKDDVAYDRGAYVNCFENEDLAIETLKRDPRWLLERCEPKLRRPLEFAVRILEKQGRAVLEAEPRLSFGTIHSVKGASADTVVLFPDVTKAMWQAQQSRDGLDAQTRSFYVGMTRARKRLVIGKGQRMRYEPLDAIQL